MSQPNTDHLKEEFMRLAQGGSTIPEDVKAKLDQLKQEFTQLAERDRRAAQAAWNAEQMANKKAKGGSAKEQALSKFLAKSKVKHRVYHGTQADFKVFDPERQGESVSGRGGDIGYFFIDDPEAASEHAMADWWRDNPAPNVMPVHLALNNPEEIENIGQPSRWYDTHGRAASLKALKEGKDGLIIGSKGGPKLYVTFKPHQIKSAIGNRGTYDPKNPDITMAKGGNVSTDGMRYALTMKQGKNHG